eukprot:TRINITY_DN9752_c2_g1_i1.p1 TRINITY_DN9752_c2_g1~~TRINITY_DN9752_c2_g1_i1.p1  ORF type:complete len:253 (+),score=31.01 TRINITY_DN9752_c2_g1_i1:49-807(+)
MTEITLNYSYETAKKGTVSIEGADTVSGAIRLIEKDMGVGEGTLMLLNSIDEKTAHYCLVSEMEWADCEEIEVGESRKHKSMRCLSDLKIEVSEESVNDVLFFGTSEIEYKTHVLELLLVVWPTMFQETTLLHQTTSVDLAKALLLLGADPRASDLQGNTPLHHAAASACLPMCSLLTSHGSDPTAYNNDGDTPLHSLCQFLMSHTPVESDPCFRHLVEHGADPKALNANGRTPLEIVQRSTNDLTLWASEW